MKKLIFILLLSPLMLTAQRSLPSFDHDTLYTSSGYKIYKGQVLHFANGTSDAGYFKFLKFHSNMGRTNTFTLQNCPMRVSNLKNYKNSGSGESTIRLIGTVTYKEGRSEEVDIIMNFDRAIEDLGGPAELTVPAEYKTRRTEPLTTEIKKTNATEKSNTPEDLRKLLVADEIKKLFALYKEGALSKEEYEKQKQKLLDRQ